jgi:hypothetical protein
MELTTAAMEGTPNFTIMYNTPALSFLSLIKLTSHTFIDTLDFP